MNWIVFKDRPLTESEKEEFKDITYMFDCPVPDDGQDILISFNGRVYMDTWLENGYRHLDSGNAIETDGSMAWMPLPLPHYPLISESSDKNEV